jgi:DNA-binding NtrC family response regulator
LKAIDSKEFSVVVADQSMPGMIGIEFLKKVKQRFPDTVGMIMSGFIKLETVSNVMNRGVVNRFIQKPLDINEIKQAVAIAIARYKINVESRRESMSIFQPRTVFSLQQ